MVLFFLLWLPASLAECDKAEFDPLNNRFHFQLPPLPYNYSDLEPLQWSQALYFHHQREHKFYIGELNSIVSSNPDYYDLTITDLLIKFGLEDEDLATNAGAHYGHSLLWWIIGPQDCSKNEPEGSLLTAIEEEWGEFGIFQQEFTTYAMSLYGSGWVWLCTDRAEDLSIHAMKNEFSPLAGEECYPFLGIDVWEHAYYLYYLYDREDWISAWWSMIDWDLVEYWYEEYASQGEAIPV